MLQPWARVAGGQGLRSAIWVAFSIGVAHPARGMTAADYLKSQPKPVFRQGHTLPRLTRFGWTLPFAARVALCEDWGYALEFGGYLDEAAATAALHDSQSDGYKALALTAADPRRYPLAVILNRGEPATLPAATWARDADGKFLQGNGQFSLDQSTATVGKVWSPEAPAAVFEQMAELRAAPLRAIRAKAPVAIVLNGGEYALGVAGASLPAWEKDPRIVQAKGGRSWYEYVSQSKARQEWPIAAAARAAAPDRDLYIYYTTSANAHSNRYAGWEQWAYGFEWMRNVSDLPSGESYYHHFNDGWTGDNDILTQALNARGIQISDGAPLSYDWVCGGWPRADLDDHGLGDIARYTGFLKCLYTAGMLGANGGYYDYPEGGFGAEFKPGEPPHWLRQLMALGHVHALFSYLEPFLRQGSLLPGPGHHRWTAANPAYEFPTGSPGARVLARQLRASPQWLLTAWAAGGNDREVMVAIPELGVVKLQARTCGSVYRATLQAGKVDITLLDKDGLTPTVANTVPVALP